jgi:transposase-like protein
MPFSAPGAKLRKGTYFPGFLEPRRTAELGRQCSRRPTFEGISTRSVDEFVRAMGMEGISKSQVSRPLQRDRCRFHFMRYAIAHAGKRQRRIVAAWIGTAFAEADAETARAQWRRGLDQARTRMPKLAIPMDDAEADYGFEWMVSMVARSGQVPSTRIGYWVATSPVAYRVLRPSMILN